GPGSARSSSLPLPCTSRGAKRGSGPSGPPPAEAVEILAVLGRGRAAGEWRLRQGMHRSFSAVALAIGRVNWEMEPGEHERVANAQRRHVSPQPQRRAAASRDVTRATGRGEALVSKHWLRVAAGAWPFFATCPARGRRSRLPF